MKHAPLAAPSPDFFARIAETHRGFRAEAERVRRLAEAAPDRAWSLFRMLRRELRAHGCAIAATLDETMLIETLESETQLEVLRERELRAVVDRAAEELDSLPGDDPRRMARLLAFADLLEVLLDVSDRHLNGWRKELGPAETRVLAQRYAHRLHLAALGRIPAAC